MTEQMLEETITIKSKENIAKFVQKVLDTEMDNKKLIRALNEEFENKGLNAMVVKGLFETTVKYENLSINEQIAFMKASHEILKWSGLNPEDIFTNYQLSDYKAFFNTDKRKNVKEMVLDDMTMIDDFNLTGRVSYDDIAMYMQNVVWRYNPKTQRASKTKRLGTKGDEIRQIDVNEDHVHDIANLILDGKFEQNQIILNVLLTEDSEPDFKFQPELRNIGRLTVRPHYEANAKNFTVINILDGYHRILGVCEAVRRYKDANNGKTLQGGLDIRIVFRDVTGAIEIIKQIFQRSDTDKKFLKSTKDDSYGRFVDMVANKSSILRDQVEITIEEARIEKKLTYRYILMETIKNCVTIEVDTISKANTNSTKMAENIDTIINILKETYFDNSLEVMKEKSFLLDYNIFVGYIAIANRIIESGDFYDYDSICKKLYSLTDKSFEEEIKRLGLTNKSGNYRNIYHYFENLVKEVIKVA